MLHKSEINDIVYSLYLIGIEYEDVLIINDHFVNHRKDINFYLELKSKFSKIKSDSKKSYKETKKRLK